MITESMGEIEAIKVCRADILFAGSDWRGTEKWTRLAKALNEIGRDVVHLPHADGISSTELRGWR